MKYPCFILIFTLIPFMFFGCDTGFSGNTSKNLKLTFEFQNKEDVEVNEFKISIRDVFNFEDNKIEKNKSLEFDEGTEGDTIKIFVDSLKADLGLKIKAGFALIYSDTLRQDSLYHIEVLVD